MVAGRVGALPAVPPIRYSASEATGANPVTDDDTTKRAVQFLLKRGVASYIELAQLSGRSRQIVRHWAKDLPDTRAEYLARQWAKAIKSASR